MINLHSSLMRHFLINQFIWIELYLNGFKYFETTKYISNFFIFHLLLFFFSALARSLIIDGANWALLWVLFESIKVFLSFFNFSRWQLSRFSKESYLKPLICLFSYRIVFTTLTFQNLSVLFVALSLNLLEMFWILLWHPFLWAIFTLDWLK